MERQKNDLCERGRDDGIDEAQREHHRHQQHQEVSQPAYQCLSHVSVFYNMTHRPNKDKDTKP